MLCLELGKKKSVNNKKQFQRKNMKESLTTLRKQQKATQRTFQLGIILPCSTMNQQISKNHKR